ncbi:hypothetical protein AMECASPLE_026038 [Ameca splendens]|uniref:Uncharacterized protein n=1 Tax=Ameca splendens TaxID=208324 RepID=A0ABV0YH43_9TELE
MCQGWSPALLLALLCRMFGALEPMEVTPPPTSLPCGSSSTARRESDGSFVWPWASLPQILLILFVGVCCGVAGSGRQGLLLSPKVDDINFESTLTPILCQHLSPDPEV